MHAVSWAAGQQVSKLVVVPGQEGYSWAPLLNVSSGSVVVSATVVGYYTSSGTGFLPVGPSRVARLRIAARHTATLPIGGWDGLPAHGIGAALLSLTATGASKAGAITGWAAGTTRPAAPILSYAGQTAVGSALIAVAPNGRIELYNSGPSAVTLTVTMVGAYYQGP